MAQSKVSTCRLCGQDSDLCLSHAIPNAFFRSILRSNHGSAIAIPKDNGKIHLTGDSGKAKLLCQQCEARLNTEFDKPLIKCLRNLDGEILRTGFSARIKFNHDHLARCIASVYWRGCVSSARMYKHIKLSHPDEATLFQTMTGSDSLALQNTSVSFMRLYDPTTEESGGFTQGVVSNFVFPITAHKTSLKRKKTSTNFALTMCLQGFLICLFVPRLPHTQTRRPKFLKSGGQHLHAPPTNMLLYPPLMDMMVGGLAKVNSGDVTSAVTKLQNRPENN